MTTHHERKRPYVTDKWHQGRDGGDAQKAAILFEASSGFRRKRAGCLATTPSRHAGSRALLAQTVEATTLRSTSDRHRQAEELCSSEENGNAERGTSTSQGVKQPGGELTSADKNALSDACDNSNPQDKRNDLSGAFGPIRDHFHPKQHQLTAERYRQQLRQQFC